MADSRREPSSGVGQRLDATTARQKANAPIASCLSLQWSLFRVMAPSTVPIALHGGVGQMRKWRDRWWRRYRERTWRQGAQSLGQEHTEVTALRYAP